MVHSACYTFTTICLLSIALFTYLFYLVVPASHSPQDARKPCTNRSLNDCSPQLGADGVGCDDARITHLNIFLTTCTACPGCSKYVHDEEIMAAWSMDEDEYNIHCPFCDQLFVPQLTVRVVGEVGSSPVKSLSHSTASPSIPPRVPDVNRSHHGGSASGRFVQQTNIAGFLYYAHTLLADRFQS
ncbi:hypothetical protein AHF37_07968 [Paragonimus kellicotti]|nr:hypothetical protein AHF37_07968 [Paragonimus kellicotti]